MPCLRFAVLMVAWLVLTLGAAVAAADRSSGPPNIVFILADDLGWTDTAPYGSQYYETPHLSQLAAEGLRFTQYHNCQNCQPTRAALMTGQYSPRTGVYTVGGIDRFNWQSRPLRPVDNVDKLPLEKITIAQRLRETGYATGMFGKWHLGQQGAYHPSQRGFDEAITTMGKHFGFETQPPVEHAADAYLADWLTDRAVDFLRRHRERPFFLYLPHFGVHSPHEAKPELIARFRNKPPVGGHHNPTYAAMIASVDESVGRVLRELADLGLKDNTVVIFSSDNGGVGGYVREGVKQSGDVTDNAPLRSGKGSLYEGGVRDPFIVRWPGVTPAGATCDVPCIHVDVFPTLLEIARTRGASQQPLDGESLVPLLRDPRGSLRRDAIFQHFPGYLGAGPGSWRTTPVGTIQAGDWKLLEFFEDSRLELYNLREDVGETRNLVASQPAKVAELHGKMKAWRTTVLAKMPTPNTPTAPLSEPPSAPEKKTQKKNQKQKQATADSGQQGAKKKKEGKRGSPQKAASAAESPAPRVVNDETPFGSDFPRLDSLAVGEWWSHPAPAQNPPPSLDVARDEVIAFALYTHESGTLKLTAQLFPLRPGESREARLEVKRNGQWTEIARSPVQYPGWSAHFRVPSWDPTQTVPYRVRHGERAEFTGTIRRDPVDQDELVVAVMSCNSSRTTGLRPEILDNLLAQNPDLLFFAGDQTYRHTEHTAGWIEFGLQFRDVIRDRPTITIPDDHDVGHGNLWGENGRKSTLNGNADGGYFYPVEYVNMVQRQQTWHLPDPVDPAPVERNIGVYFTRLRVGGIDFAILEDRKFKSGPAGKIPQMGPRPDHINDTSYNPRSIDLPGLQLLGERQMRFLRSWGNDWTGADLKVVLSQTAFCGAVHLHGQPSNRLLADLDCNGWPQSGRNAALEELRRVRALHLCGDQHLAVVVRHGITTFGDGPYAFTSPALVNTIYGRWWHPADEKPGPNPVPKSPLPWTGDFLDGLGNRISLLAYANPPDIRDEKQRADGYGLVRIRKQNRQATFECWPRFSDVRGGDSQQFPGWPITVSFDANDGRRPVAWLPELVWKKPGSSVVQVVAEGTGEVVYTLRVHGERYELPVYAPGKYTLRTGPNSPDQTVHEHLEGRPRGEAGRLELTR